jgi:hypothetical protein
MVTDNVKIVCIKENVSQFSLNWCQMTWVWGLSSGKNVILAFFIFHCRIDREVWAIRHIFFKHEMKPEKEWIMFISKFDDAQKFFFVHRNAFITTSQYRELLLLYSNKMLVHRCSCLIKIWFWKTATNSGVSTRRLVMKFSKIFRYL